MKKLVVSIAAVASLVVPSGVAFAKSGPDPDANGDVHSNCHTGSKFRGAGGEDREKLHGNGEAGDCAAAPPAPPAPAPPAGPAAAPAASSASAAPASAASPAVPVVGQPRQTG
jgi:hypothetical protein